MKHTKSDLLQKQSLPLSAKIRMTELRIRDWYEYWEGDVYISFSGGKDSTVLLDLVRNIYPDVEAVFVNTGLEYPEIQQFVKTFDNVTILRPKMRFDEVIKKYGYPLISKSISKKIDVVRRKGEKSRYYKYFTGTALTSNGNKSLYNCAKYKPLLDQVDFLISNKCCDITKKAPIYEYEKTYKKRPYVATMASEGKMREAAWFRHGCNAFDTDNPQSKPLSFFTEQDILNYIKNKGLNICSVYGSVEYEKDPDQIRWSEINSEMAYFENVELTKLHCTGCNRTGCIFCGFGCHLEDNPNRFEMLKKTHPRQYKYCIEGGEYNDQGLWQPSKKGLGMGHVFDELNKIYGEDFIRY